MYSSSDESSSSSSSHSSRFTSESLSDSELSDDPSSRQKHTRSREVFVTGLDSDESDFKHLGKTKAYDKAKQE